MFLYDFWNAPFGVRIEHTHRLYGAAVGLATLVLAGWFLAFERRAWMKGLGVLAVVAVIVQGVLGGTRVTRSRRCWRPFTAVMGQAFFGLHGRPVRLDRTELAASRTDASPTPISLRPRALLILGLVAAQIALGSWLRHYGSRAALVGHAALGAGRLGPRLALFLAGRAAAGELEHRSFRRRGRRPRRRLFKLFLVSWRCFTCYHLTGFPGR